MRCGCLRILSMHTICRKFTFDAAHRVLNHTGKCKYIHGHRYVAEVYCYAAKLDAMGMVVDFGLVKDRVGWWIDNNLDHNVILHPLDPLTTRALFDPILFGKEPFVMPDLLPQPTAENIAQVIYTACTKLL